MAPMGRPPKPTHLKLLAGNPGKRPLNENEPKPKLGRPAPPKHLNPSALEEWQRICEELFLIGLLTNVDRGTLAAYCQAYGVWCEAEEAMLKAKNKKGARAGGLLMETSNGNLIQHPLVGIARRAKYDMVRYATEFGLTPSSRARVQADAPVAAKKKAASFFDDD